MNAETLVYVLPLLGLVGLLYTWLKSSWVARQEVGSERMAKIAAAIQQGAMAFLRAEYRVLAIFVVAVAALLGWAGASQPGSHPLIAAAFIAGALCSALAGFIGMRVATKANVRTTQAARQGLGPALEIAFAGGSVMGLGVVGLGVLGLGTCFLLFSSYFEGDIHKTIAVITGFSFGASSIALFARVGGGIYTKAADVGADLVGKVEAGIPEDDPRNPATIADNVGDNVGDVAGMGADLYESYAGSILATSALGVAAVSVAGSGFLDGVSALEMQLRYIAGPVALAAVGVFLSVMAIYLVRADETASQARLIGALSRGLYGSSIGIALLAGLVLYLLGLPNWIAVWVAVVAGLVAGLVVGKATEYYTSHAFKPTRGIAAQAETSSATALIEGLAVGMESGAIPVLAIVTGIAVSFYVVGGTDNILMGLYGVGIAAVGMLSTLGFTLATDAYGPIADNAGGNAEMSGLPPQVRDRTDQLDAVGNTTAAIGKGFAIGSAALTSLALLAAYLEEVRLVLSELRGVETLQIAGETVRVAEMTIENFMTFYNVTLLNPSVLIGLFAGAATAFYFSAMTMRAVGRAAGGMVEEVRRQFAEDPGILEGTSRPDYARCVAISTASAQREMVAPSIVAIAVPVLIGVLFGVAGVLGLLAGGLATGFLLAIMMANAGGAWDNAKKYIEEGKHGGKGSAAHKAAVVGDTVGDPFKDTSGPSLNILIKLMSMVSVVFAGLIVAIGSGKGLISMLAGG